jgi:hypothetical protein
MSGAMLDVKAKQGEISVSGTVPYWISDHDVLEQIHKVQGVRVVRTDDLVRTPLDFGLGT